MRFASWLTLASAFLFPLEAHALPISKILDFNILEIDDQDFNPVCGGGFFGGVSGELPACGSGHIDFEGESKLELDSYDFFSDKFPQFDSSGLAHDLLATGNPLFTGDEFLNVDQLDEYRESHPGSNPLSYTVTADGGIYDLTVLKTTDTLSFDTLTTFFQPGSFGFWRTGAFLGHPDQGAGFIAFYKVVPEPGSLFLLLTAFGLWSGFKLARARGSARDS